MPQDGSGLPPPETLRALQDPARSRDLRLTVIMVRSSVEGKESCEGMSNGSTCADDIEGPSDRAG